MQRTRFLTALVGLLLRTSQCFAAPKVSVLGGEGPPWASVTSGFFKLWKMVFPLTCW